MKTPYAAFVFGLGIMLVICTMPQEPANELPNIVLPEVPVTMMVTHDGEETWFIITLTDVPNGYSVKNSSYAGWCANKGDPIEDDTNYSVNLYSSYNVDDAKWREINYILNNKNGNKTAIQEAIWFFTNGIDPGPGQNISHQLINAAENNSDFYPLPGQICAVIVKAVQGIQDTLIELTVPNNDSGNPSGGPKNHKPTASTRAGEPYNGLTDKPILFDASQSYDLDGYIISYTWDFGDGMNGTGKTTTHVYMKPGVYKVLLTVTDDDKASDSKQTQVAVFQSAREPSPPIINGTLNGIVNIGYNFTFLSYDEDGGMLTYHIDWGDGTNTTTEPQAANSSVQAGHFWTKNGAFVIAANAIDGQKDSSAFAQYLVFIGIHNVGKYGYLIDTNGTGVFDAFYSNITQNVSAIQVKGTGQYVIDSNGDGTFDLLYTINTDTITELKAGPTASLNLITIGTLAVVILVISLAGLFTVFLLHLKRKKHSK